MSEQKEGDCSGKTTTTKAVTSAPVAEPFAHRAGSLATSFFAVCSRYVGSLTGRAAQADDLTEAHDAPRGQVSDSRSIPAGGADVGSPAQSKFRTVHYCVADREWVLSVACIVNRRCCCHSFLVGDCILHGPLCCIFFSTFFVFQP